MTKRYNPPPNWPTPPNGWTPPAGWEPDPSWGPPPAGWQVWTDAPAGGGLSTGAKVGLGVLAAFVGLCAVGGIGAAMSGDTPETDPVAVTSSASASASPTTESPEDAAQAAAEKAAADKAAEEKAAADKAAEEKAAADKAAADRAAADKAAADAAAAAAAEAAKGTFAQQNAYESAVSYLDFAAFSRSGLLQQLSSEYGEGYVLADAEFAIARMEAEGGVDWNAEAAESAKSYLSMTSFSRQGLLEQLTSEYGEGFTPEQAEYGVSQAGL